MDASKRGAALFITFIMMLMLAGLALAIGVFSQNSLVTGQSQLLDKQAFFIGEAGVQRARQLLGTGERAVGNGVDVACGENVSFGAGEYNLTTAIAAGGTLTGGPYTITSDGYVPNDTTPAARRQLFTQNITPVITLGSNLSLGVGVVAVESSHNAANAAEPRVHDDHPPTAPNTFWQAGTIGNNSWVGLDFGVATAVDEIIILENGDTIVALTIESSANGVAWAAVTCLTISATAAGATQTFTTRFNQETSRFFRAFMTSVNAGQRAAVQEMRIHNTTMTLTTGNTQTSF